MKYVDSVAPKGGEPVDVLHWKLKLPYTGVIVTSLPGHGWFYFFFLWATGLNLACNVLLTS